MPGIGILISLDEKNQDKLSDAQSDVDVVNALLEIEEQANDSDQFSLDKAWNIIHRSLTDGLLEYDNGEYPLNMCIMDGFQLHEGDETIISVVPQKKVSDVADALQHITYEKFKEGFSKINKSDFPVTDDDIKYGWDIFQGLPDFWKNAALKHHAVVFNVDL
jgi:hypothetical protein